MTRCKAGTALQVSASHKPPPVVDRIIGASTVLSDAQKRVAAAIRFKDTSLENGCYASTAKLGQELGRPAKTVGNIRRQLKLLKLVSNHSRHGPADAWHIQLPEECLPCGDDHDDVMNAAAVLDAHLRKRVAELKSIGKKQADIGTQTMRRAPGRENAPVYGNKFSSKPRVTSLPSPDVPAPMYGKSPRPEFGSPIQEPVQGPARNSTVVTDVTTVADATDIGFCPVESPYTEGRGIRAAQVSPPGQHEGSGGQARALSRRRWGLKLRPDGEWVEMPPCAKGDADG